MVNSVTNFERSKLPNLMNDPIFVEKKPDPAQVPGVPWTPLDVVWGLAMSILVILFLVMLGQVAQSQGVSVDPGWIIIFGTSVLLLPVWYFAIHKYGASWADLGLRRFQPKAVGIGCGLMALALIFNVVYGAFLGLFGLQIQPDIDVVFENSSFPLVLLFGGAIVAPFVEELFFRGFVFTALSHHWDWKKAMYTSAGLFAVAHVIPTAILPIFILGVIFAFLYHFSGSIWPAILMHMLTNTLALSVAFAVSQGWVPAP